jgi:hypothetical protein
MARDTKVIYDQMANEKATLSSLDELLVNPEDGTSTVDNAQNLLNQLTTTSKVGIWRLFMWVIAFAHHILETLWDKFREEIEQLINAAQPGTVPWYQKQALAFQYGHDLVWNGKKYVYLADDSDARIITRCSVIDPGGVVRIKVAKGGAEPEPLSAPEQLAFTAYMNQIKFAGTNLLIVNLNADKLSLQMEVWFNPLFIPAVVKSAIITAINDYLKSLPFNGVFRVNDLKDVIRAIPGVIDVDINHCKLNSAINITFQEIEIEYQTVSGYLRNELTTPLDGYYDAPTNSLQVIKMTPYV